MIIKSNYDEIGDVFYASYGNSVNGQESVNDYEFILHKDKCGQFCGVTIIGFQIISLQEIISIPEWKDIPLDIQTEVVKGWEEIHNKISAVPFSEEVKQKIIEANKKWDEAFKPIIKEMEKDN